MISHCRDPKSVNSHVNFPWDVMVREPRIFREMSWECSWYFGLCSFVLQSPWNISSQIFNKTSHSLYAKISLPFMLIVSFISGLCFATLAFLQIWVVFPAIKILSLHGLVLRKLSKELVGEVLASVALVWRFVFAGRHLNINTVNTELSGVFVAKQHCPTLAKQFRIANLRDKTKVKYQNIKRLKLPFSSRKFRREIVLKMDFMRKALDLAQSKLPSLEVLESAFRLAVVKREERFNAGKETFRKSLKLARTRRNEDGSETVEEELDDIKKDIKFGGTSLWVLAKQLALARLKRGKTNWIKAKKRVLPERKHKTSFWFRAKNVVFTPRSRDKLREKKKKNL